MTKNRNGAIIAIHGVGTPKPGDIVAALTTFFPKVVYTRSDLTIEEEQFARLVSEEKEQPDLLEVNWSDVKRPPNSIYGVVEWTIALSIALARTNLEWSGIQLKTGPVLAVFTEAVLLWIVYPVLLGFMRANLHSFALAAADAAVVAMAIVTYWMARRTTKTAAAAGAAMSALILVLAIMIWRRPEWIPLTDKIAIRAYGLAQIVAAALIGATAVEVAILAIRRKITGPRAMARIAFAYLPVAMLSALGSCVWALSLNVVVWLRRWEKIPGASDDIDQNWQQRFLSNLGYDLRSVEWAMAGATFALGCFVILAVLKYRITDPPKRGRVAQKAIWYLTLWAPVCLAIPGTLLALTSPLFGEVVKATPGQNVWHVYTISALRVIPWFVASITGIRVLLDVLADVVFYITKEDLNLSTFNACNERLSLLIIYAQSKYQWVHVISHSQGSVIANKTLSTMNISGPLALTTMGSPLGPIYEKYLDWSIATLKVKDWANLYRSGDYIGGEVGIAGVDKCIGEGGHVGYWADSRIGDRVRTQM